MELHQNLRTYSSKHQTLKEKDESLIPLCCNHQQKSHVLIKYSSLDQIVICSKFILK